MLRSTRTKYLTGLAAKKHKSKVPYLTGLAAKEHMSKVSDWAGC